MHGRPLMEFGYNPPSGDRKFEVIRPHEFVSDLHRAVDVASQGFKSIWVSDHLAYRDEFRLECWTQLAWTAARYPDVKLGTIVLCNSFRHPALLAKMAASLQALSGGRLILGYGAGWLKPEYDAYGYDFPPLRTRVAMLEEGVQVIRALWTQAPANFQGRFYRLANACAEPRPDPPPPIMIGGAGEKWTLPLVARHADWWNDLARPMDELTRKLDTLRRCCEAEGRDFSKIRKTWTIRVFIHHTHAVAVRRAEEWGRTDQPCFAGDPSAVRDRFTELAEHGIDLCIVVFPRFQELDDLRLFADKVVPAFF